MTEQDIAGLLMAVGCPADKAGVLAAQLSKRADQLAEQKGKTREEALVHLLTIVRESGGFPKD